MTISLRSCQKIAHLLGRRYVAKITLDATAPTSRHSWTALIMLIFRDRPNEEFLKSLSECRGNKDRGYNVDAGAPKQRC